MSLAMHLALRPKTYYYVVVFTLIVFNDTFRIIVFNDTFRINLELARVRYVTYSYR